MANLKFENNTKRKYECFEYWKKDVGDSTPDQDLLFFARPMVLMQRFEFAILMLNMYAEIGLKIRSRSIFRADSWQFPSDFQETSIKMFNHRRMGRGAAASPKFGQLRFFGQQEKFGQSQFLKKFACVCACCCFFRREIFSILN